MPLAPYCATCGQSLNITVRWHQCGNCHATWHYTGCARPCDRFCASHPEHHSDSPFELYTWQEFNAGLGAITVNYTTSGVEPEPTPIYDENTDGPYNGWANRRTYMLYSHLIGNTNIHCKLHELHGIDDLQGFVRGLFRGTIHVPHVPDVTIRELMADAGNSLDKTDWQELWGIVRTQRCGQP